MRLRSFAFVAVVGAVLSPFLPHASGQSVISTRAGLINFSEGLVYVDGHPLTRKFGAFERLKNGSTLVTESGRAEVLLTPNTYLRVGENSSIRMVSDDLSDPQVEILAGSTALDSESASPGSSVHLTFRDSTIRFLKPGRYRIDADPPQLRVFAGEAEVVKGGSSAGSPITLESAQLMPLDGAPVVKRFTEGSDGLLDLWADERHSLIASNLLNSQSITDPLLDSGPDGSGDYLSSLVGAYGGYIPMAGLPTVMGSYYGYTPNGYNPYGYNPYGYNPYGYSVLQPYGVVVVRPTYSRVLTIYGQRIGTTSTIFGPRPTSGTVGTTNIPRPVVYGGPTVFGPRPTGGTAVHVGGRVGGHR
jgi:hypothetical protein